LSSSDYGETWEPGTSGAGKVYTTTFTSVPATNQEYYPFQSAWDATHIVKIPVSNPPDSKQETFTFSGGKVDVNLYYGGVLMQSYVLNFPGTTAGATPTVWPVPAGDPADLYLTPLSPGLKNPTSPTPAKTAVSTDVTTWNAMLSTDPSYGNATNTATGTHGMAQWYWLGYYTNPTTAGGSGAFFQPNGSIRNKLADASKHQNFAVQTSLQAAWSFATRLAWAEQENGNSNEPTYMPKPNQAIPQEFTGDRWHCVVQPGDTIRSLLYWDGINATTGSPLTGSGPVQGGDLRVEALSSTVPTASFAPHPDYNSSAQQSRACVLRGGDGTYYFPTGSPAKMLSDGLTLDPPSGKATQEPTLGNHIVLTYAGNATTAPARMAPSVAFANLPWSGGSNPSARVNGVYRQKTVEGNNLAAPGDWDNGLGSFPDGPFANKQDEGNIIYHYHDDLTNTDYYPIPYFTDTWSYQPPGDSFTSPSRQMPSAGMFGSLPSHAPESRNWETLCFSPIPAGTLVNTASPGSSVVHPGNVDPKDHLLLDLFQMPVVEPYPISEPFSTAGKINLNYRIAPFDYIRRETAVRAALYPIRVTIVPSLGSTAPTGSTTSASPNYQVYKTGYSATINGKTAQVGIGVNFRKLVDRDQMMAQLDSVYDNATTTDSGFFKSATQICEQFFIPVNTPTLAWNRTAAAGVNARAITSYWTGTSPGSGSGELTGDNCREKPYTDLYPRLTTKSNTYTVHMKVQALRQVPRNGTDPTMSSYATWSEGKDAILGEYRGSATIERYLDPADPRIGPNSQSYNGTQKTDPDTQSLESLYRFRTVITKKFSP
jgi:uncharacterized protein (TIGR02600 family)